MKFIVHAFALSALLAASACAQNETASEKPATPVAPVAPAATAAPKANTVKGGVVIDNRTGNTITSSGGNVFVRSREAAPVKKEKGSYLGVSTSSPTAALRYQIGLKPGFGLVVDSVEPASPAEEAGIKRYDILTKFDDQQLINNDQFLVLVRAKSPGDSLMLSVMREGKTVTLNAKTVERDVVPVSDLFSSGKASFSLTGSNAQADANLAAVRVLARDARDNPWSTYAKKQITDDVSDQTWTFSWDDGQLLRADYKEDGQKKVFMYRFDQPDKAKLPDQVKKALDAYTARKKTTIDEIYKSIEPKQGESSLRAAPTPPGI